MKTGVTLGPVTLCEHFCFPGACARCEVESSQAPERVFLDQDNDCHWYIVKEAHRAEWEAWLRIPDDDQRSWTVPDFAEAIGGAPSQVVLLRGGDDG